MSEDYEPGWGGLSLLFFWWKWQWVHNMLGHIILDVDKDGVMTRVCACGMEWKR